MKEEAEKLKSNGVHLFTVGVGSGVDSDHLKDIASRKNVYSVQSYTHLSSHIADLTKQLNKQVTGNHLHG